MNAIPILTGPIEIPELKDAVGHVVKVEDFVGNIQDFRIVSYNGTDLIKLEVLKGEHAGVKVFVDLGTSSIVGSKIKRIKLGTRIVFDERFISEDNRKKSINEKKALDINEVVEEERERFKKTVEGLLSVLGGNGALPNSSGSDDSTWGIIKELGQKFIEDRIISEDYLGRYLQDIAKQ